MKHVLRLILAATLMTTASRAFAGGDSHSRPPGSGNGSGSGGSCSFCHEPLPGMGLVKR